MYKKISFVMLLLVSTLPVSAGSAVEEALDKWLRQNQVKGISVSVFDGKTVVSAVRGVRRIGATPLLAEDRFAIASLTKSFTAAAILKILQNNAQTTIQPAYQLTNLEIPKNITVQDLLTHSSGIKEYMGHSLSFEVFLGDHAKGRLDWKPEEIYSFAAQNYDPADRSFSYTNSGYVVLASIIENARKTDLATALKNAIIAPLDLNSIELVTATSDMPEAIGQSDMLAGALGSAELDVRLMRELATAGYAAGGMTANSPDLAKWAHAYFSGDFVEGVTFSEPAGGAAFGLSKERISVGPGVYRIQYGDRAVRIHGGDGLGSSSVMAFDEKTGKSVAILVNDDGVRSLGFGQAGYLDELVLLLLDL